MNQYPIVYVTSTRVYIQWNERAPFIVTHEDGTRTEQWREPVMAHRVSGWATITDALGDD